MWLQRILEKFNPAQEQIATEEGSNIGSDADLTLLEAFDKIEAVNRGASMVINACASLDYDIKDKIGDNPVRSKSLHKLLNFAPNPYQSAQDFRKNIFTDFLFEGMAFIHFDGKFIYHLPASRMEIITDRITYIKGYKYGTHTDFKEDEVFSFKDVNTDTIYRGASRLNAAKQSINTIYSMQEFQKGFFDNGAVFGLILTSDNALSKAAKERTILHWIQRYSPKKGGRRPVILDNGLKPHSVANNNFKDMDFDTSLQTHSEKIYKCLGVPPILMQGGNNANISPNLRLFYLETVLPIVRGYTSALERYFGFDVEPVTSNVSALQPDLKDVASYHATLTNAGIITPDESREALRYDPKGGEAGELRIPANIAGSASNPSEGGRPTEDNTGNKDGKE